MSYTPKVVRKKVSTSGSWPWAKKRLSSTDPRPDTHTGRPRAPLRPTYGPNEGLYEREPSYIPDPSSDEGQENISHDYYASAESGSVVAMFQQQQSLLQTLITQQQEMRDDIHSKYDEFDKRLAAVEDQLKNADQSTSSNSSLDKRKIKVTRDLSKKVSVVHDSLEEGFRAEESSKSKHNSAVKKHIIDEVVTAQVGKYNEQNVQVAVKRKYESIRRQWKEQDVDGHDEIQRVKIRAKKYRQRKRRKFENRALVVMESEVKYWSQLTVDFMTEESDDDDDRNALVVHHLLWRSKKLSDFLTLLDKRYEEKVKKEGTFMARKIRHSGTPSTSEPPADAPVWTIDPDWTSAGPDAATN